MKITSSLCSLLYLSTISPTSLGWTPINALSTTIFAFGFISLTSGKNSLYAFICLSLSALASFAPQWSVGGWLENVEKSGGALGDLHIHDTDLIVHFFGVPESVHITGTLFASNTVYKAGETILHSIRLITALMRCLKMALLRA